MSLRASLVSLRSCSGDMYGSVPAIPCEAVTVGASGARTAGARALARHTHGVSEDPRQAEVENLGDPLVSHHDVPGLQVPVNDSVLVRFFERVRNLHGERKHLSLGQL